MAVDVDPADSELRAPDRAMLPQPMLAIAIGTLLILVFGVLAGWMGLRAYQSHQAEQQAQLFIRVARQGALNLTTINYTEVDADVKRILDSTTGTFHDEFQTRAEPFVDVVKKSKAETVGTITESALESRDSGLAQVLVAVSVKTSNAGVAEPAPRLWRMRVTVQEADGGPKVSNVGFVS